MLLVSSKARLLLDVITLHRKRTLMILSEDQFSSVSNQPIDQTVKPFCVTMSHVLQTDTASIYLLLLLCLFHLNSPHEEQV